LRIVSQKEHWTLLKRLDALEKAEREKAAAFDAERQKVAALSMAEVTAMYR
jgi:hypothetical protein